MQQREHWQRGPPLGVAGGERYVASLPRPTRGVLTFMLPEEDLTGDPLEAARSVALNAAATAVGFGTVFHLTPAEADRRYFAGRGDSLRAPQAAQVISATV
jgi:hypothetical protein